MKKKKVGVYKLKRGGYQVSFINSTGKRKRLYFDVLSDANAEAYKVQNYLSKPQLSGSDLSVSHYLGEYLKVCPKPSFKARSSYLTESFLDAFGKMPVHEVNKIQLIHWLDSVKDEKKYSARTMLQCKYAFTPFFKYLVDMNVIDRNLLAEVKVKKGTRFRERVFLSEPEIRLILEKLKQVSPALSYPVTYFLVHTGCKINEALSLKWDQLDLCSGIVHFQATKSSDERIFNLSPLLVEFLRNHRTGGELVFLDEKNRNWTPSHYNKRISRDRAHVQLHLERHWDNFSFRTSFAYHFLRKGGTLPQLQALLGHRGIISTITAFGDIISRAESKTSPYEQRACKGQ